MAGFFDPERGVWPWLSTLVDIFGLSILWLLLCLPLITAGPATAALYYTVVKCVRGREPGTFGCYFRSFRQNFKTGVSATLICLAALSVLTCGYLIMRWNGASNIGYFLYVAYYVALIIPAGILCWLFPLLGRFDFRLGGLFRTAFQLAVSHLPTTVVAVLLTAETAAFCAAQWWPALFMPAFAMLLISLFFERIFRKYAPELAPPETETPEDGEEA